MKVTFVDEVKGTSNQEVPSSTDPPPPPPPPPPPADEGDTPQGVEPPDPPPPYEEEESKPMPTFKEDPMMHLLDMKVPKTKVGFCACSMRTTTYAIAFYIAAYASMLIVDSFGVVPDIIRSLYAYKFQLFLDKETQFYLHGWFGAFLLLAALVLWWATLTYNHTLMLAWMIPMTLYVLMTFAVWLLGMLLSLSSDGWNVANTQGISIGVIDVALEFYLLQMVYSYNRYMDNPPDIRSLYDPRAIAQREWELAQRGLQEINLMGLTFTTPMPIDAPMPPRPRPYPSISEGRLPPPPTSRPSA